MIALTPDPGCREGLSPILLNVTTPTAEIHYFVIESQRALQGMRKTEYTVITFHARYPGIPTHDPWRKPCHRPGVEWSHMNFASELTEWAIHCQIQMTVIESVFTDLDRKMPIA